MSQNFSAKKIIPSLIIGLSLVFLFSLVNAWQEPSQTPPNGNVPAPINVSATPQVKTGSISAATFYDSNDNSWYINPNGQSVLYGPVGIGTRSPTEKLEVAGKIRADGVIYSESDPSYDPATELRTWGLNKPYTSGAGNNLYLEWGSNSSDGGVMYITDHWNYTQPLYVKTGNIYLYAGSKAGLMVDTSGKVGIGTPGPDYKLDVQGKINTSEALCINGDCKTSWSSTGVQGSGTTNYVAKFTNSGTIGNSQIFDDGSNVAIGPLFIDDYDYVGIGTASPAAKLDVEAARTTDDGVLIDVASASSRYYALSIRSGDESRLYVRADGNVGIGTENPQNKLYVNGTLGVGGGTGGAPLNYGAINFPRITSANDNAFIYPYMANTNSYDLRLYLQDDQDDTEKFSVWGGSCSNGGCSQGTSNAIEQFHVTAAGNGYFRGKVGIGTSPNYKLDVQGKINASGGLCINEDCKTSWSEITGTNYWTLSGSNLYPNSTSYNVGIGTTAPGEKLDVAGSTRVRGWDAVYKSLDTGGNVNRTFHLIGTYHGWDPEAVYIAGYNYYNPAGGDVINSYAKRIHMGRPERMTIDLNSGNVGIGTTTPDYKLDVQGKINASGGLCINGDCKTNWSDITGTNWSSNGKNIYYNNGNVGIGTMNPTAKLDIYNPYNITLNEVGYINWGGGDKSTEDVYVSGNYAYVANYHDGLRIIDISDPSNPVEVGHYNDGNYIYGVYAYEDSPTVIYIAEGSNGYKQLDVSDPSSPKLIYQYNPPDSGSFVNRFDEGFSDNNIVYIAEGNDGIRELSWNGNSLEEIMHYDTPDFAHDIAISNYRAYAYVADGNDGLRIIDLTSLHPYEKGHYDISDDTLSNAVAVKLFPPSSSPNKYVCVAWEKAGLVIIDVSNPYSPYEVGRYNTGDSANDVYVSDDYYAYVADGNDGLRIIDISDPSNPVEVGHYDTDGYAKSVYVSGNYAYVADTNGLKIIDVSSVVAAPPINLSVRSRENNILTVKMNGNIGIGTITPGSLLDVNGTAQLRGSAGGTGLYVDSNSNVGIGTTTPKYKLDVNGSAIIRGDLNMNNNKITNIANPTVSSDAATKDYVDKLHISTYIVNIDHCLTSAWRTTYTDYCPSGYVVVGASVNTVPIDCSGNFNQYYGGSNNDQDFAYVSSVASNYVKIYMGELGIGWGDGHETHAKGKLICAKISH